MKIVYFEPLTLIDYPGVLATTVFTLGCTFRCSYCHSPELVDSSRADFVSNTPNAEEEFFRFLNTRRGKVDGVCITGGEPTIHANLTDFIRRIKNMGFVVKLDTNGNFPDRVTTLLDTGLVDYWAMDIKHAPDKYKDACGVNVNIDDIKKSVALIMKQAKDYEFRTTAVPGIHTEKDFTVIGQWIAGARAYYIQPFRSLKVLDKCSTDNAKHANIDYNLCLKNVGKYVDNVKLR